MKSLLEDKIAERGFRYLSKAVSNITENNKLRSEFNKCSNDMSNIGKKHVDSICKLIIKKTIRARSSCELGKYREKYISQYAKDSSTDPF